VRVVNPTAYASGWNVGHQPDGREAAVVVVKGTFVLSACDGRASALAERQLPLLEADVQGRDPARHAPIHEHDFALFKPRCDVLLRASAHAPGGRLVANLEAGFMVGACRKALKVWGRREWRKGLLGVTASGAEPFLVQPITYDHAFGGMHVDAQDPTRVDVYRGNPAGTGYARADHLAAGLPLPVTEALGEPVTRPDGHYRPMAFGPVGRHWLPRCSYAGTYDEQWQRERMPYLPADFNPLYLQAAPADQQMAYPQGGEPIVLLNLTPSSRLEARLPADQVTVRFVRHRAPLVEVAAHLDTIVIEPDEDRLSLTWRASCPLVRDPFELVEMQIEASSSRTPALLRSRQTGKKYYGGLSALVRAWGGEF